MQNPEYFRKARSLIGRYGQPRGFRVVQIPEVANALGNNHDSWGDGKHGEKQHTPAVHHRPPLFLHIVGPGWR